jgi:hypothetical protein
MIKSYTTKEQMQNELQWWEEQKLFAIQEKDLKYVRECEDNIKSLLNDIMSIKH